MYACVSTPSNHSFGLEGLIFPVPITVATGDVLQLGGLVFAYATGTDSAETCFRNAVAYSSGPAANFVEYN